MSGLSFVQKSGVVVPIDSVTREMVDGVIEAEVVSKIDDLTVMTMKCYVYEKGRACVGHVEKEKL